MTRDEEIDKIMKENEQEEDFEESEEDEENPFIKKERDLSFEEVRLREDPYNYICNFYEAMYPCVGKKIWSLLSLLPVSLIIPKIPRNGVSIRSRINVLFIAPSGMGKSSQCRQFEKITYNPISSTSKTPARMVHDIRKMSGKKISIIIEDIATMFEDDEMVKLLEGIIGEESVINRENMRNVKEENKSVEAIALFCGTNENISDKRIQTGILRRVSSIIVTLSKEEQDLVFNFINKNMGNEGKSISSAHIQKFYDELYEIQNGENKIPRVEGYIIPESIKAEINNYMKPLAEPLLRKHLISSVTEYEQIFRIMCSHAFLNIHNKIKQGKVEGNKILIDDEDMKIAKKLIYEELRTKCFILDSIASIDYYGIKTKEQLKKWEDSRRKKNQKELPREAKYVLEGLVRK